MIPREVDLAFRRARLYYAGQGIRSLGGMCVEASCLMYRYLSQHAPGRAKIIRRDMGEEGGHWTVWYEGVEYDPTCGFWPRTNSSSRHAAAIRRNIVPWELHVVSVRPYGGAKAPHNRWPVAQTSDTHPDLIEFCRTFRRLWEF